MKLSDVRFASIMTVESGVVDWDMEEIIAELGTW